LPPQTDCSIVCPDTAPHFFFARQRTDGYGIKSETLSSVFKPNFSGRT